MKTDRLYAITVYLLNHGKTSAAELSRKFEVSVRTIQRDIDAICQAGIPVIAQMGMAGGYYLPDSFKMDAQTATEEDYSMIHTALKGFSTAMNDPKIDATLEKVSALSGQSDDSVILDFSVLREIDQNLMRSLQMAIQDQKAVRFHYTNAENVSRVHTVEPIAIIYRWYAWYLLAYSTVKNDYRTYKLVRMANLELTDLHFTKDHANADAILKGLDQKEPLQSTKIQIRCKPEARAKAIEYLNGEVTREYENGECDMTLHVIEREHLWLGTILSLGDGIIINEPEHIRRRILEAAKKIAALYDNYDTQLS